MTEDTRRREFLQLGGVGLALTAGLAASAASSPVQAQEVASGSRLRTVLDRGHLIVGTGSTNAPWHFEDQQGQLDGMDITVAKILAKGLFDDETKIEFVRQEPAARIPNILTGKVDIVIQFMTTNAQRAQQVAFSRPYYVEGNGMVVAPDGKYKTYADLKAGGKDVRVSILQNVYAEELIHSAGRADAAGIGAGSAKWLATSNPETYKVVDHAWGAFLYCAAMPQGDPDWVLWVNTALNVAMHGSEFAAYSGAVKTFFGETLVEPVPGFPRY